LQKNNFFWVGLTCDPAYWSTHVFIPCQGPSSSSRLPMSLLSRLHLYHTCPSTTPAVHHCMAIHHWTELQPSMCPPSHPHILTTPNSNLKILVDHKAKTESPDSRTDGIKLPETLEQRPRMEVHPICRNHPIFRCPKEINKPTQPHSCQPSPPRAHRIVGSV
jgi:hypothetical protein